MAINQGERSGNVYPAPPPSKPSGPSTASTPAPSQPSAPPTGPQSSTDWTTDPIYQLVLGQQNLAIAQAKAEALKEQTQALIAYGDPNLALAVTGDENVANAARANKASTLAQLMAQNSQNVRNINETENKNNLWYSSDRGYQQGLAQQTYLFNQANALTNVQGTLGSISSNLLAAEQQAYLAEEQAATDAYNRAVQNPGLPSSGGQGGGISTSGALANHLPSNLTPAGAGLTNNSSTAAKPTTMTNPTITANKTGGSANQKQGVYAIH